MIKTLVTILCVSGLTYSTPQGDSVTETLQSILNNYDPRIRPHYGANPLEVSTTAYFLRGSFNEKEGLLTVEGYYRESWNDPRLRYQTTGARPGNITTGSEIHKKIWEPDTFVANGAATFNEREMFYRISSNGDVLGSKKIVFELSCPEYFGDYPVDTQLCFLETESYGYSAADVVLKFSTINQSPVGSLPLQFNNLRLVGIKTEEDSISLKTGTYSRLKIGFRLARSLPYYVKHYYAPAILVFLVCWSVFWLPSSSVLLRGVLGFMCMKMSLVLTERGCSELPAEIGYMTKMDDYMVTCTVLALIALFESVLVFGLYRNRPGAGNLKNTDDDDDAEIAIDLGEPKQQKDGKHNGGLKNLSSCLDRGTKYALNIRHHRRAHEKIDFIFRFLYPSFFILFNIIYWVVIYKTINNQEWNV